MSDRQSRPRRNQLRLQLRHRRRPRPHQTIQQFLASGGQFLFNIDLNPGVGNDPLQLHAVYDPVHNAGGSHVVWRIPTTTS